jgi:hypothetical protein
MRPGVPTTTCTPRFSPANCGHSSGRRRSAARGSPGMCRGVALEGFGDLDRQFAGRRQHQRLRRLLVEIELRRGSARRMRRSCRCRSAPGRARRAFQQGRNGGGLDRRRGFVTHLANGLHHGIGKAKIGKTNVSRRRGGFTGHAVLRDEAPEGRRTRLHTSPQ